MEWTEFLESVAIKHKLTSEQRETLIVRLDRRNDNPSNIRMASDLNLTPGGLKKRLGEIYKIFEQSCPDLARSESRGKLEALRACLWQQYERQQSQPPQPEPIETPRDSPYHLRCIQKLQVVDEIQELVGRDDEIFREVKIRIVYDYIQSI